MLLGAIEAPTPCWA